MRWITETFHRLRRSSGVTWKFNPHLAMKFSTIFLSTVSGREGLIHAA
jgi:hypothetical protein